MTTLCLISVFCLLGYAHGGFLAHPLPAGELETGSPPQYEFHYSVHDSHTGDVKDQFEHRRGDYVTGRYSLIEPDGNRRVVEYNSDPHLGFTAQVHREPAVITGAAHHIAAEQWPAPVRHP